jgi:cytochrome P450
MASTTDKRVHARKRRIISHAMSEAAIRSYEPTILDKTRLFCQRVSDPKTFEGPYKNMSRWFSFLTYDIMGELTFSQSYDMLTKSDNHFIQPLIDSYQHSQVIVRPLFILSQTPIRTDFQPAWHRAQNRTMGPGAPALSTYHGCQPAIPQIRR